MALLSLRSVFGLVLLFGLIEKNVGGVCAEKAKSPEFHLTELEKATELEPGTLQVDPVNANHPDDDQSFTLSVRQVGTESESAEESEAYLPLLNQASQQDDNEESDRAKGLVSLVGHLVDGVTGERGLVNGLIGPKGLVKGVLGPEGPLGGVVGSHGLVKGVLGPDGPVGGVIGPHGVVTRLLGPQGLRVVGPGGLVTGLLGQNGLGLLRKRQASPEK